MASASQQAAGQAAQRAEERLKALVLGADYSEKNWYYVDPQVCSTMCLMQSALHPGCHAVLFDVLLMLLPSL